MRTFYIKYSTSLFSFFFFLNDPAPPEIYPLPLHDALPISLVGGPPHDDRFAFHRHGQVGVDEPADLALGALHGDPQAVELRGHALGHGDRLDRKSTRLNSSHGYISYAVFCLKKKKKKDDIDRMRERLCLLVVLYVDQI